MRDQDPVRGRLPGTPRLRVGIVGEGGPAVLRPDAAEFRGHGLRRDRIRAPSQAQYLHCQRRDRDRRGGRASAGGVHSPDAAGAEMRLARAEPVFWDVVDGATVICHEDRAAVVRLNDSARLLWEEIDGATLDDLVDQLGSRFPGTDRGVLYSD